MLAPISAEHAHGLASRPQTHDADAPGSCETVVANTPQLAGDLLDVAKLSEIQLKQVVTTGLESEMLGHGHEAQVKPVDDYSSLVLRMHHDRDDSSFGNKQLRFVPVVYDQAIRDLVQSPNFGIIRAVVVSDDEGWAATTTLQEIAHRGLKSADQFLNRCGGTAISDLSTRALRACVVESDNYRKIMRISQEALTITMLPANTQRRLRTALQRHTELLQEIAALPQASLDVCAEIVKTMRAAPKEVTASLGHGGNLLYDSEKKSFSLVDINVTRYADRAALDDVALAIFGRQRQSTPWHLFLKDAAYAQPIRASMQTILTKFDDASKRFGTSWQFRPEDGSDFSVMLNELHLLPPQSRIEQLCT